MEIDLKPTERDIFATALRRLNEAGIPYVVAGAFATHFYTGYWRYTKDMDLFAEPEVVPQALAVLNGAGFQTWVEADHWLSKAKKDGCLVDIIFGSGNWLAPIDRLWLERSVPAELLGVPVRMAPIDDMIWAKSYIAGRERYDGADVCHLIMASEGNLDWDHLLWRYGDHWQLLLSYLNLFSFVYPANKHYIPDWVIGELLGRLEVTRREPPVKVNLCRGTLLDRFSYNYDVEQLGYVDAREYYAKASGGTVTDVIEERAWADERLAKGEVYKEAGGRQ